MIRVVDYDPEWPAQAAAAMAELSGFFTVIEHIGSTAVPGLAAKPVIDLMAAVPDLTSVAWPPITRRGYHRHHNGMTDRLLFVRSRPADTHAPDAPPQRTHILHVVTLDSWPTRNQRLLRDHLRTHPADADRYAALKRSLAQAGTRDYARAKTALIQELTDRARAAAGLPAVPVWEKG